MHGGDGNSTHGNSGGDNRGSSSGNVSAQLSDAREAARTSYFDLLKQLQGAVRTIVLSANLSNSCVRCSDGLCLQLFRVVRACLLAGCRRFSGADPAVDELLFLLVVPEFVGVFSRDIDFIAYLFTNHAAAPFALQLFGDTARINHFYIDCAIARDEELHLAFVSSLLALESVTFHPDFPQLAEKCLQASLADLRFQPVLWASAKKNAQEERLTARPDPVVRQSDLASRISKGRQARGSSAETFFAGFRVPAEVPKEVGNIVDGGLHSSEQVDEQKSSKSSAWDVHEAGVDTTDADTIEASLEKDSCSGDMTGDTADISAKDDRSYSNLLDDDEFIFKVFSAALGSDALLRASALSDGTRTVVLEELRLPTQNTGIDGEFEAEETSEPMPESAAFGRFAPNSNEGEGLRGFDRAKRQLQSKDLNVLGSTHEEDGTWKAVDLSRPLMDGFGLYPSADDMPDKENQVPELVINLIDIARKSNQTYSVSSASQRAKQALQMRARIPAGTLLQNGAPLLAENQRRLLNGLSITKQPQFASPAAALQASCEEVTCNPSTDFVGDESDEAADAIASLEGLWQEAKRDGVRRMMKSAGGSGSFSRLDSRMLERIAEDGSSEAGSTGRGSTSPPTSLMGTSLHDDAMSDCGSQFSWSSDPSVSSYPRGSLVGQHDSSENFSVPGIHLEWKLKLRPRLPIVQQVALQRGICPGCQERLPNQSFLNMQPGRYCHYLEYYFCHNCHRGDLRIIPARVAERWDFEPKKVCIVAAQFLDLQVNQPLVPITKVKRTRVSSQAVLTEVHHLRQKFSKILQVLTETECPFKYFLDTLMSNLDSHLAVGYEWYSLSDLVRMELEGKACPLLPTMSRLVETGEDHIRCCSQCQGLSHYCIICRSGEPIFPFEIKNSWTCPTCQTVSHRKCIDRAGAECPICLKMHVVVRKPCLAPVRPR